MVAMIAANVSSLEVRVGTGCATLELQGLLIAIVLKLAGEHG